MIDTVILHTNEICLKGRNRSMFEKRLLEDARKRLAPIGAFALRRDQGNIVAASSAPLAAAQVEACRTALASTFGVAWIVFAGSCAKDLDAIKSAATDAVRGKEPTTFKVFATRRDKTFPMDSQAIAREVGAHLLDAVHGLAVDVHQPRTRVAVEIAADRAYVSADREPGAGGLPTGASGSVVALLSGGIDSPVAAWKIMRRGCVPVFVHFHSYPYVGRASVEKVRRLAGRLAAFAGGASLYLVPIGEAQKEITVRADESVRVLLYRRLMLRVAERIARTEDAKAIVTGESVGQVASQTLENIAAVSAVARLPILRPLIGDDKEDIVRVAKRIGTYATSIEPHDDCCTLFVPQRPATKADAVRLDREEAKYDVAALVDAALANAERVAAEEAVAWYA